MTVQDDLTLIREAIPQRAPHDQSDVGIYARLVREAIDRVEARLVGLETLAETAEAALAEAYRQAWRIEVNHAKEVNGVLDHRAARQQEKQMVCNLRRSLEPWGTVGPALAVVRASQEPS